MDKPQQKHKFLGGGDDATLWKYAIRADFASTTKKFFANSAQNLLWS